MQITVNQLRSHETPDQWFTDDDAPVTHHRDDKQGEDDLSGTFDKAGNQWFCFFTQCLQRISHIEEDTEHRIERSGKPQVQGRVIQNHILCGAEQCNQISSEGKENDYRCNTPADVHDTGSAYTLADPVFVSGTTVLRDKGGHGSSDRADRHQAEGIQLSCRCLAGDIHFAKAVDRTL